MRQPSPRTTAGLDIQAHNCMNYTKHTKRSKYISHGRKLKKNKMAGFFTGGLVDFFTGGFGMIPERGYQT